MAAVDDRVDVIEAVLEDAAASASNLSDAGCDPRRIREQAIGGGDDIGLDPKGADHAGAYSWLSELTSDRNSCRVAGWSRNTPSIRLVTRSAPRLRTPRSIMQ